MNNRMQRGPHSVVRAFNRFYTEAIGVLADEHLETGLTLGQARLLYEVGQLGAVDVQGLRTYLDLDPGYVSRTLAVLEKHSLISLIPLSTDRRGKMIEITEAGRAKISEIDNRSNERVKEWLAPLNGEDLLALTGAMERIQRVLARQMTINPADPTQPEAKTCLDAYFSELSTIVPDGFNPSLSVSASPDETKPPYGTFLLLRRGEQALGCGAVKTLSSGVGEIKRMWIHPKLRGLGVGRRLLTALEKAAFELGLATVRLDTRADLKSALKLYTQAGYKEIPKYNDNPYATHWFEKYLE